MGKHGKGDSGSVRFSAVMDHISTLLPKVLRKRGIKDEADASLVVHEASMWLRRSGVPGKVTKLKSGTLFIEAPSSIAAQECHASSNELLEALRLRFPDITIENVRIVRES